MWMFAFVFSDLGQDNDGGCKEPSTNNIITFVSSGERKLVDKYEFIYYLNPMIENCAIFKFQSRLILK